jgi:hypothetical protein
VRENHVYARFAVPLKRVKQWWPVQLTLDLSVDVDSSAHLIYALPAEERERAYGRLRRLKLMDAIRSGFAPDLAHRIAENGSDRTRGLVLGLCAAADQESRD